MRPLLVLLGAATLALTASGGWADASIAAPSLATGSEAALDAAALEPQPLADREHLTVAIPARVGALANLARRRRRRLPGRRSPRRQGWRARRVS